MPENKKLLDAIREHEIELAKLAPQAATVWDGVFVYGVERPVQTLADVAREAGELLADLRTHNKLSPAELARIDACRARIRRHIDKL